MIISLPESTLNVSLPDPPSKVSPPAFPVIISSPPPPLSTSALPAPSIVKFSVWLVKSSVEPDALASILLIFFNLLSVVKVCVPADNCRVFVPALPSTVSLLP